MTEDVPLPLSEREAMVMAGEMDEYLNGGREPDERFHEIAAALSAVGAKAALLQTANQARIGQPYEMSRFAPRLSEEEIEFLRTFYGELDEMTPNGLVHLMPWLEGDEGPDWGSAERDAFAAGVADGLLTLSDEGVGGGQYLLPERVRDFANGLPVEDWRERGLLDSRAKGVRSLNWLADAEDFARLLQHSDPGLHGGTEFSANVTLSTGHHLGHNDLAITQDREDAIGSLLEVTTRNESANHAVLTGGIEHPAARVEDSRYASEHMPDFGENRDALAGLYSHDWRDDGEAVAGLTDWITEFAKGTPGQAQMAGDATVGLMETLAGEADDRPFHDTQHQSDTNYQLAVTEVNPEIAESLTGIYLTYLADLTLHAESSGYDTIESGPSSLLLHEPSDKALFIDDATKERFVQLLIADVDSADFVTSSIEALEIDIINAALDSPHPEALRNAGNTTGGMRTIIHDAMIHEFEDRTGTARKRRTKRPLGGRRGSTSGSP
ncbi:hypothetical protein ABZ635_16930 [Nocardiopsis sp. NPDC007018]|uniref:TPR repeat region-containing protein n=1 Tax=Nocardiopsis sp. NPDC007018 TaxID=3155721 RepID=UPI003402C276